MRLLRFQDTSVAAAMAQVRRALGAEALILSTRRHGTGFEVTAAIETAAPAPEPADTSRVAALAWHGVPDPLARAIRAGPLPFALSVALRFAALPLGGEARPLLLLGPPGVGKTLTVARLATRLVLAGARPLLVTADATRAGADEQLAAFARLLGLDLCRAPEPAELARAVSSRAAGAAVLIDTAGLDPFDPTRLEAARALARAAGAEPVAVLAAGCDAAESADMAVALAGIGARLLVATRLDLARRLGGVVAAAQRLALAELGVGPGAADGLVPATPALLARRLATTAQAPR